MKIKLRIQLQKFIYLLGATLLLASGITLPNALYASIIRLPQLGQHANEEDISTLDIQNINPQYIFPNARSPQDALRIIHEAPNGFMLSLQNPENLLTLASLTHQITGVIGVNNDLASALFLALNIDLITAASDQSEYSRLRFNASFGDWITAMSSSSYKGRELFKLFSTEDLIINKKLNLTTAQQRAESRQQEEYDIQTLLKNPSLYNLWRRFVDRSWNPFTLQPLPKSNRGRDFQNANYAANNEPFEKLSSIAKTGQMTSVYLDYLNTNAITSFVDQLEARHVKLSVLYIGDLWKLKYTGDTMITDHPSYLTPAELKNILKELKRITTDKSLVILTNTVGNNKIWHPTYYGIPMRNLKTDEDFAYVWRFIDSSRANKIYRSPSESAELCSKFLTRRILPKSGLRKQR